MIATTPDTLDAVFLQDPLSWLAAKAKQLGMKYLLVHTDEGVVWGRLDEERWVCSFEAFPDDLDSFVVRAETLQQARIFDQSGEIFVWRTGHGFAYRQVMDEALTADDHLDEAYWLWGTGLLSANGFTLMEEGEQGFCHAPPVNELKSNQRLGIKVRHYIVEEEDGWQRIKMSRLVGFEVVEGGEK